jgi:hypothetical protein
MADERKAYAGDLTSDAIGKRVRVRTMAGTPTVDAVQHYRSGFSRRTLVSFTTGASTDLSDIEVLEVLP